MSEDERRYVNLLIEIAQRRVAELASIFQNGTADPESPYEATRWLDTIASLKIRLRCADEAPPKDLKASKGQCARRDMFLRQS